MVIEPTQQHTHTVIFLHRFPVGTTEDELNTKILSAKMTKNHKQLYEQFPSLRWIFPHAKDHARPWTNLSAEDKANVELTGTSPYITQVIMKEAKLVGGLEKIVLGGQGEAAEAAHEAMSSFPEIAAASLEQADAVVAFIQEHFHSACTAITHLKLAGFVGMHTADGHPTQDVRNYGVMSKMGCEPVRINNSIVTNTPHRFIKGGYKIQTVTWDGRRIDEFAEFLTSIDIERTNYPSQISVLEKVSAPQDRLSLTRYTNRAVDDINAKQKHAQEIIEQAKAEKKERQRILRCIEADKVERKIKQARELEARRYRQQIVSNDM